MKSDYMEKVLRLANSPVVQSAIRLAGSPAVGLSAAACSATTLHLTLLDNRMKEVVGNNEKPAETLGKRLPLCEVICSCEPG